MNKGDAFSFCPETRHLIDQPQPSSTAFLQSRIQVINRKADVMDSGAPLRDEFPDRRVVAIRLEKLNQRIACDHRGYVRPVGISNLRLLEPEDIGEQRHARRERLYRDSNMSDASTLGDFFLH